MRLLQRYVIEVPRRQQLMVVRVIKRRVQHKLRIVDHRGARPDERVKLVPGPPDRGDPAVLDGNRPVDTAVSGHAVRAADPEHDVGQMAWRTGRCGHAMTSRLALGPGAVTSPSTALT